MATKSLVISKGEGRSPLIHSVPAVRRDPQQTKGERLLLPYFSRLGLVSVSYLSRLEKGRLAASLSRRVRALARLASSSGARCFEASSSNKESKQLRGSAR